MFIELSLLPKFTLLLAHPIYSAATVLSSILCFAGLGSMSVSRFQNRGSRFLWGAVAIISAWVAFDAVAGGWIFSKAMAWPLAARMALTVFMISVLAFFLGWPFPSGLRMLAKRSPGIVPWAWGINGCASVTGAVIAKCLTVSIGFRLLMFAACLLYVLAALCLPIELQRQSRMIHQVIAPGISLKRPFRCCFDFTTPLLDEGGHVKVVNLSLLPLGISSSAMRLPHCPTCQKYLDTE